MESYLFRETQKFNQIWIWVLLLSLSGAILWGIVRQVFLDKPIGPHPIPDIFLILLLLLPLALMLLFRSISLTTTVEKDLVLIEFHPFATRIILEDEIAKHYIRTYQPIREFGGWGLRIGIRRRAYTLSGKEGVQLELHNGHKILIGTKDPEALDKAITRMFLV
ncbi:MAG: hypothetical protein KDC34_01905 [Saprospiraceae bacterium]|nr:hypothetical protein [Saprospiraceae bacterium]